MGVARPEERRDQVPALSVEDQQGMVHVLLIVAVVVGTFLLPVGRISGRIEVQKHLLWSTVFSSLSQVEFEDCLGIGWQERLLAAFSKREMVGWLARSSPLSGKEPQTSLNKGSSRKELESFWSSYPHAICITLWLAPDHRVAPE